jgi:hypothetical protein
LPESIKRGGGKSLPLTGQASDPPAESGNDALGKRGMVNGESEDERSGKMRRGFAVFIYLRAWRKIFPGAAVVWSAGRSRARKSRVK